MNKRIFVEKKEAYDVESKSLLSELRETLHIDIRDVKVKQIYDVFGLEEQQLLHVEQTVLAEAPVDIISYDFVCKADERVLALEYLPGQYDQRADSARQCIQLLFDETTDVEVQSGKLVIIRGASDADYDRITQFLINPVEMRQKDMSQLQTVKSQASTALIPTYDLFCSLSEQELQAFLEVEKLSMSLADLQLIQKYFQSEKRNPTETEIKVLDTYWSDHCRHTTFETVLETISFTENKYTPLFQEAYELYQTLRKEYYQERSTRVPETLMDMATLYGKWQHKKGMLTDLEVSDEINACSVFVDVDVDSEVEKWIMQFKNETHNHPTEIEPFGGAATCIGGAIRDPLAGRTYVYQGMRISGAGNPTESLSETLKGKLPQKVISQKSASGFSSYGNQIGLATTYVRELYHPGYKAKHMEAGFVVGAAKASHIIRKEPKAGDLVLIVGGLTGRDGCGGATGSSKKHDVTSLTQAGSEVQKGNAVVERKLQRFFQKGEVTQYIKRCNDFGAGGVAVAIGELADGLEIHLNEVPVKYIGLSGTELAISESQERMAVVIDKAHLDIFIKEAELENLMATHVATVTELPRMIMYWNDQKIVDLSRDFIQTSGAKQFQKAQVTLPQEENETSKVSQNLLDVMKQLNVGSQIGLSERFDASIGAGTVLAPYGGKYQKTRCDVSIQKFPVKGKVTTTASIAAYGYDPYVSEKSPFHGAVYSVVEAVAKIVAAGASYEKIRLSFQEYFERLGNDEQKWGNPVGAMLGALYAQTQFSMPAIGGKDSMSGTFEHLHVPPTCMAFAITTMKTNNVISSELKQSGNFIYLLQPKWQNNDLPDFKVLLKQYDQLKKMIDEKVIVATKAVGFGGVGATLAEMTFGNRVGCEVTYEASQLFTKQYGAIIIESKSPLDEVHFHYLGKTRDTYTMKINDEIYQLEEVEKAWESPLLDVFPTSVQEKPEILPDFAMRTVSENRVWKSQIYKGKPKVLVLTFPGTNCEFDMMSSFRIAGAEVVPYLFCNMNKAMQDESIQQFIKLSQNAQILALPGGFSLGDEPDGSAKFIAQFLLNPYVKQAVEAFLARDGLIIGICNGFQALMKSGLLPHGKLEPLTQHAPTLTYNQINRHVARFVQTKIVSNQSPWLSSLQVGDVHSIAISHGEGRLIVDCEEAKRLFDQGQVITQYVNTQHEPTMGYPENPNGSAYAIEGLISPDGKIIGKMGHSERYSADLHQNIAGDTYQGIFVNGVNYFK